MLEKAFEVIKIFKILTFEEGRDGCVEKMVLTVNPCQNIWQKVYKSRISDKTRKL